MTKLIQVESDSVISGPFQTQRCDAEITRAGFTVRGVCSRWRQVRVTIGNFSARAALGLTFPDHTEMSWLNLSRRQKRQLAALLT